MKKYLLLPIAVFIFYLVGCEKNSTQTNQDNNFHFLSFMDYGCQKNSDAIAKLEANVLDDWNYQDGILELQFRFITYCGATFVDSCAITNERADLYLTNVQEQVTRCVCEFVNVFTLNWPEPGLVRVVLNYRFRTPEYHTMMDTVLNLR